MLDITSNVAYGYHSGNHNAKNLGYYEGYAVEIEYFVRNTYIEEEKELLLYGILHKNRIQNNITSIPNYKWTIERDSTVDIELISCIYPTVAHLNQAIEELDTDLKKIGAYGGYKRPSTQAGVHLNISKSIFHHRIPDYFIAKLIKFIHNNQSTFIPLSGRPFKNLYDEGSDEHYNLWEDIDILYEHEDYDYDHLNPFKWARFHNNLSFSNYGNGSYDFLEIKEDRIELRLLSNDNNIDLITKRTNTINELIRFIKNNDSVLLSDFLIYLEERQENTLFDFIKSCYDEGEILRENGIR